MANALAQLDWLVEAAKSRDVHELAQAVPERGHGPGRKREHPAFVGVLYVLLAGGVTGSHRSAAVLLGSERVWRLVRLAARSATGLDLPRTPPTRNMLEAWRAALAKHVELLREHARDLAVRQAVEAGCFDPNSTPNCLRRADALVGDGKVVAAPILSKTADKWREAGRRIDTGLHKQAGETSGVYVTGSKFLLFGVRASDTRNARILLDVAYLPPEKGYGGEAGAAVGMIGTIQRLAADHGGKVNIVNYDGALRGKHADPLMKSGLTVLFPTNPSTAGQYPLELVEDCGCGRKHPLVTIGGRVQETWIIDTGAAHTEPCPVRRLIRRRNLGSSTHRWYQELELSCGRTRLIRLDSTEEDQHTGRNRAERVHQHAPDSQVYQDCYGWREEAESWNNSLDRTLYGERMIAHTAEKQLLSMLGFMLARNVLAAHALGCERLRSTA